jgi:hypothetical protein
MNFVTRSFIFNLKIIFLLQKLIANPLSLGALLVLEALLTIHMDG